MSEHISYGVTSVFDWYELSNIASELGGMVARLQRVLKVIEQREKSQHEYIHHLRKQCDAVQVQLNRLRKD